MFVLVTALVVSQFVFITIIKRTIGNLLSLLKPKEKRVTKKSKKGNEYSLIKKIAFAAIISWTITIIAVFSFWMFIVRDLPSPNALSDREIALSTKIFDRNGVLLYSIYKDENRTPISLELVPSHVIEATLSAEDAEFYEHPGFSVKGISRAVFKYLRDGTVTGGSTITQQLVKNALLTPEKTLARKLREVLIAIEVERIYSKDQILEMYLNEVSYGGTAYGIEAAAKQYFDKSVNELAVSEAAFLAGLPKSPTIYSPFSGDRNLSKQRQIEVLRLMAENGFISEETLKKEINAPLEFANNQIDILAPHFVMYVRRQLVDEYGEEYVSRGGLRVETTIDSDLQMKITKIIQNELESLKHLNVTNAAAVVLDSKNGEILAMVGSKDYFNSLQEGNVNVATRVRQPGSTIKLVTYAYALSHGYTPATIIDDTPVRYEIAGQEPYIPRNYDNQFKGKMTLRSAFAESRNVPAVKILERIGIVSMFEMGRNLGINTWTDPNDYGLSLTLGGGGVTLLELAEVYGTIANMGHHNGVFPIKKIENSRGRTVYETPCTDSPCGELVLDPRVAFQIIDILSDNDARAPAFGTRSALYIETHPEIAVKTGTSNDLRDNFTIGFNQDYVVAIWVGNNDNSPMSRVASGVTGASPIWNKVMRMLLTDKESVAWDPPDGVVSIDICPYTGTLPCDGCGGKKEWFLEENTPQLHCSPVNIAQGEGS